MVDREIYDLEEETYLYTYNEYGLQVEFEHVGEGQCGDYNVDDLEDVPLLRFYVSQLKDGKWVELVSVSQCTNLSVFTPESTIARASEKVAEAIHAALGKPETLARIAENLSWFN